MPKKQAEGVAMGGWNYDDAIAVTHEIHWIGFNDEQAGMHCNP